MIKESGSFMGGGGRHGAGAGSKNQKPGYMAHLPENHLNAYTPQASGVDRMSHANVMSCANSKGGNGGV